MKTILSRSASVIRAVPVIGDAAARISHWVSPNKFTRSDDYWDNRYDKGGDSGAGSYGRLAQFKADVINALIDKSASGSVIEFGCGDGAQLGLLSAPAYVGVDVSPTIIARCREKFAGHKTYRFYTPEDLPAESSRAEIALSLDVIYHLVEDDVFAEYMARLFDSAERCVVIYSSNEDRPTADPHVRHRRFTDWIDGHAPAWSLAKHIANPYPFDWRKPRQTSFADFYIFRKAESVG